MIQVESISKKYSGIRVLNNISFTANQKEVIGILGPNGAGKTTLMRLLSGFILPDEGLIKVNGINFIENSKEIRGRIGYLSENCPLYSDMRVDEYLKYRAIIKGVKARYIRERMKIVKSQCGLNNIGRRIIGQLSKGCKQRIGIADSLIHNPEILILDEPTVGLDPNQVRDTRELIMSFSDKHTIFISTHIMQEVEAICDHVLVIKEGQLICMDSISNFRKDLALNELVVFEVKAKIDFFKSLIESEPWVNIKKIDDLEAGWLRVLVDLSDANSSELIYTWASNKKLLLRSLQVIERSLEDAFVDIMNREKST